MSAVYTRMTARFVFCSVCMDFPITSNVFAARVNRKAADEFLVRFPRDQKTEKKMEDEILKRRERE